MVNYCCVYGCGRNSKSNDRYSFYGLPREKHRQIEWLKAAGREDLLENFDKISLKNKSQRFCSRHFSPADIKNKSRHLAPDVVPKLYLPGQWDDEKSDDEHNDIVCDSCKKSVVGFRYKCVNCEDFDLCHKCENMEVHSHHFMLRMPKPLKFKLADRLMKKWRKLFKSEHITPDDMHSDVEARHVEDSSDDDEPITKYTKNYDSGVDLSEDVKEQIRKEIRRVTNLKLDQQQKTNKKSAKAQKKEDRKRQAVDDVTEKVVTPSKMMKVEKGERDTFVMEVTPEVVFADVNDIKDHRMADLKTEGNEYSNLMPIITSVSGTEPSTTLSVPSTSAMPAPPFYQSENLLASPEAMPVMHVKLSDDLTELMIEVTSNNQKTVYKYPDAGGGNVNNL